MVRSFYFLCQLDYGVAPSPEEVLHATTVRFNAFNAPYLARIAEKPSYEHRELNEEDIRLIHEGIQLSEEDARRVVGDISHTLNDNWQAIIAEASDFQEATRLASLLGYRPARPGEFLQILWLSRHEASMGHGWFYCWEGRQPNYAILAIYQQGNLVVEFDTHYANLASVSANAETSCLFVRD